MKKRGGSLDNNVWILYVVVVIAFLNLVSFFIAQEWNSAIFFILVAVVSNAFKLSRTVSLILALVCTHIFRASNLLKEGLTTEKDKSSEKNKSKKNKEVTPKKPEPEPHEKKETGAPVLNNHTLEGLTQAAEAMTKRQNDLKELAGQLEPLMSQASKMLDKLPEGFLQNAFKK
jgi:hypothetical protein